MSSLIVISQCLSFLTSWDHRCKLSWLALIQLLVAVHRHMNVYTPSIWILKHSEHMAFLHGSLAFLWMSPALSKNGFVHVSLICSLRSSLSVSSSDINPNSRMALILNLCPAEPSSWWCIYCPELCSGPSIHQEVYRALDETGAESAPPCRLLTLERKRCRSR